MFIDSPPENHSATAMFERELAQQGYVMNLTRLWAWRPKVAEVFNRLRNLLMAESPVSARERSVLVCAVASTLGDSYCALAWGTQLASATTPGIAAAVLTANEDSELTARERALAAWARKVVRSPNTTATSDIDALREAGLSDQEIFDATAFVAFRLAFSTVNDALGARPDGKLAERAPELVRNVVAFGREVADDKS